MWLATDTPARRACAGTLALAVAVTPIRAVAQDPMRASGLEAQALGRTLLEGFVPPTVEGGALTLFPGSGPAVSVPIESLFPGAAGGDGADFRAAYGDSAALGAGAAAAAATLPAADSATARAYQSVLSGAQRASPDMTLDPLWALTDATVLDLGTLAASFADCTATTTVEEGPPRAIHVPDYRTCERLATPAVATCTADRLYHAATRTADVYLGAFGRDVNTFRFDLAHGTWTLIPPSDAWNWQECTYDFDTGIETCQPVTYADGIVPTLDPAEVCAAGTKLRHAGTWDWDGGSGPAGYDGSYYHRVLQMPACASGLVGEVQIGDDKPNRWFRFGAQWRFEYTRLDQDEWRWSHPGCGELLQAIADGFCQGTLTCTGNPGSACLSAGGAGFCDSEIAPPPVAGIERGCTQVTVTADCGFNVGPMDCWTDPEGRQHCPTNEGGAATDCGVLEADPACGFIRSDCVDGASGASGECYLYEDTYDCGGSVGVPTLRRSAALACPGLVRCMGGDCLELAAESSPDFARAAASLQAAQFIGMDSACEEATQGGQSQVVENCRVFQGEDLACKKAVGGVVDCCDTPRGVSLADYLTLIFAVAKLDSALMGLEASSTLRGAWETLRGPVASTWSEVTRPFTSVLNNLAGSTAPAATEAAADGAFAALEQSLLRSTAEWVGATFGEAAGNALFTVGNGPAFVDGVLQSGSVELGGVVGTAASWLMTAYTIYTVTMLLVQLVWECEADEFQLGVKRELKSCHYLGSYCKRKVAGACIERRKSYCCFNSPLARILQEQIRPQLGLDWGSARDPSCQGITVEQLATVDWSRVNLDEWLAILASTGQLPTVANLSLDRLTGTGSTFNLDGTRVDAAARSRLRATGLEAPAVRRDAATELRSAVPDP